MRPSSALLTAALLTGCGGAAQPPVASAGADREVLVTADRAPSQAVPDRSASWMARGAASAKSLLYISDPGTFDVDVYTFPDLKRAGKLTGFDAPQGECADTSGNVWVTNTLSQQILEFAHGGTRPIHTLADPTGFPGACAVDAASGDLAVANFSDASGAGEVLIYRNGRGTPSPYANPAVTSYYFDGYDAAGNLYVSGTTAKGSYVLSRLARGRHAMTSLSVAGGTVYFPGSVQWSGTTLVLGDQECGGGGKTSACLYAATVSGKTATITTKTTLTDSCDVAQTWIQDGSLAAGNYDDCRKDRSGAYLWKYPAGGLAVQHVTGPKRPVGATISNL